MSGSERRRPGWYGDPTDGGLLRYWDGSGWTPHTTARSNGGADSHPPATRTPTLAPGLDLTARLPEPERAGPPDHTTVPIAPTAASATPPGRDAIALGGSARGSILPVAGAVTAAASLVVALAALGVALGR
ncbi:DUF2510 domain-containing protein [Agromyces aurantiacus]|uniref:DUF2510 domain-containing protein n=1 Tax=Agromyces aurantiacus TaxID=165814 RepID=A0ABV9R595_9MICO|nr:DUF2510 domain-containing protein [Agromyces aurantiacus]MBM7505849.1 hypothetical protein [Agromyces aurantiacus]